MSVLQVNNIKKGFGSTDVLKGVSFSLEKGQVVTIIGSSGSGKTTLLRCLNFLETPDEGEILVNGKVLTTGNDDEIRQNRLHFGLVFQNFNLFPQYTVLENITLAPTLLKKGSADQIKQNSLNLLEQVGLSQKAQHFRIQCQRTGDGHTLLLTAGELEGIIFQLVGKSHLVQKLPTQLVQLLGCAFFQQGRGQGHILEGIILREQIEILEHQTEMQPVLADLLLVIPGIGQ